MEKLYYITFDYAETVTMYVNEDWNLSVSTVDAMICTKDNMPETLSKLKDIYDNKMSFSTEEIKFDNIYQKLYREMKSENTDLNQKLVEIKINFIDTEIKNIIIKASTLKTYKWRLVYLTDDLFARNISNEQCKLTEYGEQVCKHFTDLGLEVSKPKFGHDGMGMKSWNDVTISGWR